MSKYFAVRHEKIGFVISYFIPIAWVIMLWDSKRIRKGILLILGMHLSFVLIGMIDQWVGIVLYWVATFGTLWVWWWYYSKCVKIMKSKSQFNQ